jgi:hypothetical protein
MRPTSRGASVLLVVLLTAGCSKQPSTVRNVPTIPAPAGSNSLTKTDAGPPGATGATPRAAVELFVTALMNGDANETYALLADNERTATSLGSWSETMASLPTYRDFTVVRDDPVELDATFSPRVDEDAGVVPGKAVVHFATTSEDGGWRVSLAKTTIEPRYPTDDKAAATVALNWAKANQSCDAGAVKSLQYQGSLLGQPSVVNDLCHWLGTPVVKGTSGLNSTPSAGAVRNAFGPAADEWAKVTHIDGPQPLDVVTAPLGDVWVVVAVSRR